MFLKYLRDKLMVFLVSTRKCLSAFSLFMISLSLEIALLNAKRALKYNSKTLLQPLSSHSLINDIISYAEGLSSVQITQLA